MKSWLMPLACAAALSLPMFSAEAQAGVAGNSYNVTVVTTALDFFEDVLAFDNSGGVTTSEETGEYSEFDLGFLSLFQLAMAGNEDPEFEVELIGLQLGSIVIGRGGDSHNAQWFFFGQQGQ